MIRILFMVCLFFTLVACTNPAPDQPSSPPPLPPGEQNALKPASTETAVFPTQTIVPTQTTAKPPVSPTPLPAETPTAQPDRPAGALIRLTMASQAGVLLDDYPPPLRDQVAEFLAAQPPEFWIARARRQIELTEYRLTFRNFIYDDKGQLPLPPPQLWQIDLVADAPQRITLDNHDLVVMPYTFTSVLLTDANSPAEAEPALAEIGGTWVEPFLLPADPDFLLQRTGNACVNEGGFPPNSFDAENVREFYDFECTPDSTGPAGCHRTIRPNLACTEAVRLTTGMVETAVVFERLPWDNALANEVRIGPVTATGAADLMVVEDDLANNRIIYRYIDDESCALEEGAVGGSGWRRLLQFDATVHNVGTKALHIGPVVAEDLEHNVFQYNMCHNHFHFSNYGSFVLEAHNQQNASKQAFCVESTGRASNNETSPLTHPYTCQFQGIQAGWIDEYDAGLDTQWIDITDVQIPADGLTVDLTFISNSDQFLCEGTPVLDENGEQVWEPTEFRTEDGHIVERPSCNFITGWESNNRASLPVFLPQSGSYVTQPCQAGELGPLRNCGFVPQEEAVMCTPGTAVTLEATPATNTIPQILRVCETSAQLGVGVACTYNDALANVIIAAQGATIQFTCPVIRDAEAPSGGYSLYVAPLFANDPPQPVILNDIP
ncbi:MAG: hypothetical protein D6706_16705 [Chloroflexi bacterium]|nr:MAG: hypothetical protein D6706_16705 [Chloroflexota bacterium]